MKTLFITVLLTACGTTHHGTKDVQLRVKCHDCAGLEINTEASAEKASEVDLEADVYVGSGK